MAICNYEGWFGENQQILQMNRLSWRNNQLKFKILGELSIILKEYVEYTSIEWKQNRKMSTCKPIGFSQFHVQLRERIQFRGETNDPVWALWITPRKNPAVSYKWTGWVWEMINQLKFETSGGLSLDARGISGKYFIKIKTNLRYDKL